MEEEIRKLVETARKRRNIVLERRQKEIKTAMAELKEIDDDLASKIEQLKAS